MSQNDYAHLERIPTTMVIGLELVMNKVVRFLKRLHKIKVRHKSTNAKGHFGDLWADVTLFSSFEKLPKWHF